MATGVYAAKVLLVVVLAGPDDTLNRALLHSSYIHLAHLVGTTPAQT